MLGVVLLQQNMKKGGFAEQVVYVLLQRNQSQILSLSFISYSNRKW